MDSYLNTSKSSLASLANYSHVRIVIGNMACDLDSAVCAIVYAFHLHTALGNEKESIAVIPILNIPEKEFRLKTEVVYYLEKYRISQQVLTFRDQIDLTGLSVEGKLEIVLVDHHALSEKDKKLAKSVIEVIDHRPQDPAWLWQGKNVEIEMVGSCATLVGRKLLQTNSKALNSLVCNFLRGPILIDTANFSKKANRATPTDLEIIQRLEEIATIVSDRERDYQEILSAKTNINGLTPSDLLMKDLKIVNGIPIPGLPMLVQNFVNLNGVFEALTEFAAQNNCSVVVLMGLEFTDNSVTRDIAIFWLDSDVSLHDTILITLRRSTKPSLCLTELRTIFSEEKNYHCTIFNMNNQISRKQVLPIINTMVPSYCTVSTC